MSISVETVPVAGVPAFPIMSDPSELSPAIVSAINQAVSQEAQLAIGNASERAFRYSEKLATDMIAKVQKLVQGIAAPAQQILVVKVDEIQRKLSKPANPLLGRLLVEVKLGHYPMLVGPAGCGKTIAAEQVAEALGRQFGHICFTAGASETWLFGRQTPNGFIEGEFSRIYREGGVFLFDEIDAADANLLMAINTALANGHLKNPISGETIQRHKDFVGIAAANTVGKGGNAQYTGRNRLDAATLDRFVRLALDYDAKIEENVCPDKQLRKLLQNARKILRKLNATEVISTRLLARAYLQKQAGVSLNDILTSITMGWPEELVKQAGLEANAAEEAGKAEESDGAKPEEAKAETDLF